MSAAEPLGPCPPDPMAKVLECFEAIRQRLDQDRFHAELVAKLQDELEMLRRGSGEKLLLPLITGVVRLHADVSRMLDSIRAEPPEKATPERLARVVSDFRSDLELLLDHGGVTLFCEPDDAFNPHRQVAQRTVPATGTSLAGKVAHRVRPGFEYAGRVIEKERVVVYVAPPAE